MTDKRGLGASRQRRAQTMEKNAGTNLEINRSPDSEVWAVGWPVI